MSEDEKINVSPNADLSTRLIVKVVGVICSISIALASFSMKTGYNATLEIRELQVHQKDIIEKVQQLECNEKEIIALKVKMEDIQDDLGEIKVDLKRLLMEKER